MSETLPLCELCKRPFPIIAQERTFYAKKGLPVPTHCPECRRTRRLSMRNGRTLYKRQCDQCKKLIISTYKPGGAYTVYCMECMGKVTS